MNGNRLDIYEHGLKLGTLFIIFSVGILILSIAAWFLGVRV